MPPPPRRGFTLAELVVVLAAGGLVATAAATLLRRQQRFYAAASARAEQRVPLHDAMTILPAELRALAPSGGDVLAFSDSSFEIRATIGIAIACDTLAAGAGLDLVPVRLASGARLTAFTTTPQAGDIALVSTADAETGEAGERWTPVEIGAVEFTANACSASPLLDPVADAPATKLRLRFASVPALPAPARLGAFVRVLRRARYRLYRAGSGRWYLGYSEWGGVGFVGTQPVSGPFASYARGGLSLRYFDGVGGELSPGMDAARITRITIVARAPEAEGLAGTVVPADSQFVGVRIRNQ